VSTEITPFKGCRQNTCAPTRVVRRFVKPGHVAEIHERTVTSFNALEFIVFIDGCLRYSELFHGKRLADYRSTLNARLMQFTAKGWIEQISSENGVEEFGKRQI
jgi:hypothetical protein